MRILVLEYVSGLNSEVDPFLFPEGFAILRTLVDEFDEAGFDVITMLHEDLSDFRDWLSADRILNQTQLNQAIDMGPDAALVVAPNVEGELERITSKLRKNGIPVMGSSKYSFKIARNKWKTYQVLMGLVPQPRTWEEPSQIDEPVIIKPKRGTGCESIFLSRPSQVDIDKDIIFQENKEGIHASCCLLAKEGNAVVLSINGQFLNRDNDNFRYEGGYIPLEDERKEECIDISLKVAEALELNGYCGIDFVIGEKPWFIELNPRVTTSFVALAQNIEANLGNIIVDAMNGELPPRPGLNGHSSMRMPRLRKETKIDPALFKKLKDIPEIISPPFLINGSLRESAPIFLAANNEIGLEKSRKKLRKSIEEAMDLLRVDKNAISWS